MILVGLVAVLLAATFTAFSGNGAGLPLDSHEVFVARSAEEMLARGSFLVPYLNDEPRLKKPPLCYWLVMGVDRINGGDKIITEAEARLPSALAGVLLAGLAIALGCVLFNRAAGLIAGLLLAGSGGFVNYTHSARPEMVYAMFCTAGILGFVLSERAHAKADHRSKWLAWSGWLMMGLAMLAKGPQLPLLIVAGWIVAMLVQNRRRDILSVLRPISGLLIMAVVSLWWYAALRLLLPNALEIWKNETLERYFSSREPLSRYLDPFYLYRTGQLLLPWAALFALAALAPWLKELRSNPAARLLWWMILICMIGLSVSLGRRDYYMLPMTGAAAVLMAGAAVELGRHCVTRGKLVAWAALAGLHVVALTAAGIIMHQAEPTGAAALLWTALGAAGAAALMIGVTLWLSKARSHRHDFAAGPQPWWAASDSILVLPMLAGVIFFAWTAHSALLWDSDRQDRRAFSLEVGRLVPAAAPLLGWQPIWEVDGYYNHRTIPSFDKSTDLFRTLRSELERPGSASAECWLLVSERPDPRRPSLSLPRDLDHQMLLTNPDSKGGAWQLWRITANPAPRTPNEQPASRPATN